jgi:hypothetical protein
MIVSAIDILQAGRLSLLTALITVLDPLEKDFPAIRDQFYACTKGQPTGKLGKLLDVIYSHPRGHAQMTGVLKQRVHKSIGSCKLAVHVPDRMNEV